MSDLYLDFGSDELEDSIDSDDNLWNVNCWGTHPDSGDDTCWSGETFTTLAEAEKAFAAGSDDRDDCFIQIDGPGVHRVRKLREPRPVSSRERNEWRNEIAREAGMLGGCAAYNDAMGY
jgi:hypothetical protein